jgi:hypothetical protein
MRAWGTDEWQKWIDEAREYIGHELYDSLLAPAMSDTLANLENWKR